jgi:MFS family permease
MPTATAAAATSDAGYPNRPYAWYVVSIICIGYVFAFIDRIIVGLLTPAIQADLGLTDSQAGLLQGLAFALFYTLFGLPIGWMADRWNRKWLLTIGMAVWSIMTALCGAATSVMALFLARIGVGIGEATLNPCASSMIGDYFPPKVRPKAFGVYVMGTAIGTGFTWLAGGLVIGYFASTGGLSLPFFGDLKPWQATFVAVGLPGLLIALLFVMTVQEPTRKDLAAKQKGNASWEETKIFLKTNRVTLFCHHAGIALIILGIYGWINWMPTYFIRLHNWQPADFALWYGAFGIVTGIISAMGSGWLASKVKAAGTIDGTLRVCLVGCIGCAVGGVLAPLMPTPQLALTVFIITGLFTNFPSVLALASINEMVPNEMRALVTAIYIMMVGLLSSGLGPFAVGALTDNVFADKQAVGLSIAWVSGVTGIIGCALLAYGLKPFRESLARVTWGK